MRRRAKPAPHGWRYHFRKIHSQRALVHTKKRECIKTGYSIVITPPPPPPPRMTSVSVMAHYCFAYPERVKYSIGQTNPSKKTNPPRTTPYTVILLKLKSVLIVIGRAKRAPHRR